MKDVGNSVFALPGQAPVMMLPNALLLPNSILPLYIFEKRYRLMIQWCLDHDRLFCVALMKPGVTETESESDFFQTAGLGLVRACVQNGDGTSQLILQGLQRVQFLGFPQTTPFRIAEIRPLPTYIENPGEANELGALLVRICRKMREKGIKLPPIINQQLSTAPNPDILSDLITGAFIEDPFQRQRILERTALAERLRLLIDLIREQFK